MREIAALVVVLSSLDAAAQTAFVLRTDRWRWRADGSTPPATWKQLSFDDSQWQLSAGPFARLPPPAKPETQLPPGATTAYFRIVFDAGVPPADVTAFTLEAVWTHGFVAYLNGVELMRRNLPATPLDANTLATATHALAMPDPWESYALAPPPGALVAGMNVLAVEVHSNVAAGELAWGAHLRYDTSTLRVTRGPYIQRLRPDGAVLMWRTNRPATSKVTLVGDGRSFANATVTTDHEVAVSALSPSTRYPYAVGTDSQVLAQGADFAFTTAPPPGTARPIRIWVLGDSGTWNETQRKVRDAYLAATADRPTDLVILLGDNAYPDGTDYNYQYALFERMYESVLRQVPVWPCIGNHDASRLDEVMQTGPYFDIFSLPTAGSGSEAYYSFDFANVHFVAMDDSLVRTPAQVAWLQRDVATTAQPWLIAWAHVSTFSKGTHDSDIDGGSEGLHRAAFNPVLEDAGVDLILSGHSHGYERSILIDGLYGVSSDFTANPGRFTVSGGDGRLDGGGPYQKPERRGPHQGTVYVVDGNSGGRAEPGEPLGPLNHPVMVPQPGGLRGTLQPGSMVIDISGNRLEARYIDLNGAVLDDWVIVKGDGGTSGGTGGGSASAGGSGSSGGAGGGPAGGSAATAGGGSSAGGSAGGAAAPTGSCGCTHAPGSLVLLLLLVGVRRGRRFA